MLDLHFLFSTVLLQVGDFIGDVFEFGFWTILIILAIIGLAIFWIVKKVRDRR